MPRFVLLLVLIVPSLAHGAVNEQDVRTQARQAVALLQKVQAQWKSPCLSCHHQAMPAIALEAARAHGIAVDERAAQAASQRTFKFLTDLDAAVRIDFLIDPAMSEGYALLAAQAAGVPPNLSTAVFARHVARAQRADGFWASFDGRPPSSAGLFVATAVAARAVSAYAPRQMDSEKGERLARARKWLASARPESTEDLTYRLLGLSWTGGSSEELARAAGDLAAAQRKDGGWSQTPGIEASDAYSTAEALVALRRAGGWARDRAEFAQGIAWLMKEQAADGSWHVATRIHSKAPVSPPYFESGFPYARDQYVSCAATAWAAMALAEALPAAAKTARPLALAGVSPAGTAPWMEKALFGSATDMASIDPQAATSGGTTALMMAADNAAKVEALLKRGAQPRATAQTGYDALMIASLFPKNVLTLQLLVEAGAHPRARENVRYKASALPLASFHGDATMIAYLIEKGADPDTPFLMLGQSPATPLSIASQMDDGNVVRVLIAKGAKVDAADELGMTSVSWTALAHKNEALRVLLELGADPNVKDKFDMTPVQHTHSVQYSSPATARLLQRPR